MTNFVPSYKDKKGTKIKEFSRYDAFQKRSFALRVFNEYETEINVHFWSFKVISEYSSFIARSAAKKDPKTRTAVVFKATGLDAERLPPTVNDWLSARKELENWLRLSAIVSASAYFEIYIQQAIRSALMSNPLCKFKASKKIDGTSLLKCDRELPIEGDIKSITKGTWQERKAGFERIFGGIPADFEKAISTLEKIRLIRNEFAHGFGRGLVIPDPSEIKVNPSRKLNQATFLSYIGQLSKAAAAIDTFLLKNHIGNFELIHCYHIWNKRPVPLVDKKYPKERAFKRFLTREMGCNVSTEFCRGLIKYYESVS